MTSPRSAFLCVTLVLMAGCNSFGPTTISRDRFDYSGALAKSWKNQMLLNLVKMRYLDLPVYLEVGQMVSGYGPDGPRCRRAGRPDGCGRHLLRTGRQGHVYGSPNDLFSVLFLFTLADPGGAQLPMLTIPTQ